MMHHFTHIGRCQSCDEFERVNSYQVCAACHADNNNKREVKMSSFKIIREPHTAMYNGQKVTVLSTRCPRSFAACNKEESGAYCNIKFASGRMEFDVPIGKLIFGLLEPADQGRPKLECVK